MNKIFKIAVLLAAFTTCKMLAEVPFSLGRAEVVQKIKEMANIFIANEKTPDMAYLNLYLNIRSLKFSSQERETYELDSVEKIVLEKVQKMVKNNKDVLKLILQAKSARDLELIAHNPEKFKVFKLFKKLLLIGGFAAGLGCIVMSQLKISQSVASARAFNLSVASDYYNSPYGKNRLLGTYCKNDIIAGGAVGLSIAMLLIND